jgi:hypothetical protein
VDKDFVPNYELEEKEFGESGGLEVIDGGPIESGTITTMVKLPLVIQLHDKPLPAFVTKLGHYPIVLGIPWSQLHKKKSYL